MPTFIDQTGNRVDLSEVPRKIISIVPSQSELLWDLGVKKELVGITKFCIHPDAMFRTVERVGGTKILNIKKIRELQPDLIIGNKEENEKTQIEELQKEFNVWMSDIYNFENAIHMMKEIGRITCKESAAEKIISEITHLLPGIKNSFRGERVAYFIWNNPYMLSGRNTFIDHVLNYVGFTNVAAGLQRYPEVTAEQLQEMKPEWCLLSSEPFPFKEKHAREIENLLPGTKALIVDGELFSWYGSRLLKLPDYLKGLQEKILST